MIKYDIVKIKNHNETKNQYGVVLAESKSASLVLLFNEKNYGDYAVLKLNKSDLEKTDMTLPENISSALENYISVNYHKISDKSDFCELPFKECDYVELLAERATYAKYGIHKGDHGVIASDHAVKGKILVDFANATKEHDGMVSVNTEDLKKV